jgi:hypothetical protein
MINIYTSPNMMGAPVPLHKWQVRVLQTWQDQEDEEQE